MWMECSQCVKVAPKFTGISYPEKDTDEELFCMFTLGLFKPWQNMVTLCNGYRSPGEALMAYLSTCPNATKHYIENLLIFILLSNNVL